MTDLSTMRPMVRYRFLKDNSQECPSCNKIKSLTHYHDRENNTLMTSCRTCETKVSRAEIFKIVFNQMKDIDL